MVVNGLNWLYSINNLNQNELFDSLFLVSFLSVSLIELCLYFFPSFFLRRMWFLKITKGSMVFLFDRSDSLQTKLKPLKPEHNRTRMLLYFEITINTALWKIVPCYDKSNLIKNSKHVVHGERWKSYTKNCISMEPSQLLKIMPVL